MFVFYFVLLSMFQPICICSFFLRTITYRSNNQAPFILFVCLFFSFSLLFLSIYFFPLYCSGINEHTFTTAPFSVPAVAHIT